jgi:hypothetical protein
MKIPCQDFRLTVVSMAALNHARRGLERDPSELGAGHDITKRTLLNRTRDAIRNAGSLMVYSKSQQ